MGLEELEEHVTDQTLKINELINSPYLFSNFVEPSSWATFRDSVWGNASAIAPLERQGGPEAQDEAEAKAAAEGDGEPPPDATQPVVKFPETLPDAWSFDSSHVLVRSEYTEAVAAALAANAMGDDAFLVAGQSGIGSPLSFSSPSANLNQENHSFWFGFSSNVLHSGFPLRYKSAAIEHSSFTKVAPPCFETSWTTKSITG